MNDEIMGAVERAEAILKLGDGGDAETQVSDAIANLMILCHEQEINGADAMVKGMAHYCAAYMEPLDASDAETWLSEALFPWTGERQFPEYVADDAILLSGHAGHVDYEAGE